MLREGAGGELGEGGGGLVCLACLARCHAISRHPRQALEQIARGRGAPALALPSLSLFRPWRQSAPPGHVGACQRGAKARRRRGEAYFQLKAEARRTHTHDRTQKSRTSVQRSVVLDEGDKNEQSRDGRQSIKERGIYPKSYGNRKRTSIPSSVRERWALQRPIGGPRGHPHRAMLVA